MMAIEEELPEGWKEQELNDLIEIQNGYAFNSKLFNEEGKGMPLIRIRDLKGGEKTQVFFNGDYVDKYLVNKGDFLIGMDGEFRCYQWKGRPALLNQRVCRLQNFSKSLDPKYLFYGINKYLIEIEDRTPFVTVKHISAKQIKSIVFPVPPLEEQKRIVEKLDAVFDKIDECIGLISGEFKGRYDNSLLDYLVGLKKSILDDAFRGKL